MDLRIGIENSPQTIEIELAVDAKEKDVKKTIEEAMSGKAAHAWFEDKDGNQIVVSSDKITFAKIGSGSENRSIGFGV